jgi:hypothetical protein
MQAIRFDRKWKAYRAWKNGSFGPIQLFDLEEDPSEKNNLASANPDKVARAETILSEARTPHPEFPLAPKGAKSGKRKRR